MTLDAFLARLDDVRPVGDQYLARCPGHDDRRPSLAIRQAGDRILIYCRAHHCRPEAILNPLGLRLDALFLDTPSTPQRAARLRLSPLDEAREESIRASLREAWRAPGVAEGYQVADGVRRLWRLGLVDDARHYEAWVDEIIARETWVRGLEAVAKLLAEARAKGWRGWSPGGDSGWLRRHGIVA